MTRIAVLGSTLSGVGSGAHLTHLELARYLAERGHVVEYAALEGESHTRFGDRIHVGGAQLTQAVARADVVLLRDELRVPILLTYCRGARVVYTCHSPAGDPRALGVKLPFDSTVVWVSDCLRTYCEEKFGAYTGENVVIHGLPIDADRYRVEPGRLVTLVNLSLRKGGRLFWELAERMPDTEFLGVRGWGHQIIPSVIPPNVRVFDRVTDARMIYGLTRVILIPSARAGTVDEPRTKLPAWGEAWNRVGVEAAVSGIPAIASPVDGIRASIGEAAMYVDRTDIDGWVQAIRCFEDPAFWRLRSELALVRAAEVVSRGAAVMDAYEALLGAGVPA